MIKFLFDFFLTQKLNIPRITGDFEIDIQTIFKSNNNYEVHREIITDKIFIEYCSRWSLFQSSTHHLKEIEIKYSEGVEWELTIILTENHKTAIKYLSLVFPILFVVIFLIQREPKVILVGFFTSLLVVLINFILIKIDLIKWKKLILRYFK